MMLDDHIKEFLSKFILKEKYYSMRVYK